MYPFGYLRAQLGGGTSSEMLLPGFSAYFLASPGHVIPLSVRLYVLPVLAPSLRLSSVRLLNVSDYDSMRYEWIVGNVFFLLLFLSAGRLVARAEFWRQIPTIM